MARLQGWHITGLLVVLGMALGTAYWIWRGPVAPPTPPQVKLPPPVPPTPPPAPPVPTPPPTPAKMPLGDLLSEADFPGVLKATGAAFIVVSVSDRTEASLTETRSMLTQLAGWKNQHAAVIGISLEATVTEAEAFVTATGQPQQFPIYRAPWFRAKYGITSAPVQLIFLPDGTALFKAAPNSGPALAQIDRRIGELMAESTDLAVNPNLTRDPLAVQDRWTQAQNEMVAAHLPKLLAILDPLIRDHPAADATPAQLEERYRPILKKTGARYGYGFKAWENNGVARNETVYLTDDAANRRGPPTLKLGRALVQEQVDNRAIHVEMYTVWDYTEKRTLNFIMVDPPPPPTTAPDVQPLEIRSRILLWLDTEPPPPLITERLNQLVPPGN